MTVGEMKDLTAKFNEIKTIKQPFTRNRKLADLMTYMEFTYNIPMLKKIEWERRNPFVVMMYRTISEARTI